MVADALEPRAKDFYTPTQAARRLKVSRSTIYRLIESGRIVPLTFVLTRRIPREQIENILLGIG